MPFFQAVSRNVKSIFQGCQVSPPTERASAGCVGAAGDIDLPLHREGLNHPQRSPWPSLCNTYSSPSTKEQQNFGKGYYTPGATANLGQGTCALTLDPQAPDGVPTKIHRTSRSTIHCTGFRAHQSMPIQSPSLRLEGRDPPSSSIAMGPASSYFENAHSFTIQNAQFINAVAPSKSLFEYLEPHIAHGAAHNSDERCNAPTCHEETRKAIREDIISWIQHGEGDDEPKNIMWLSGPAGSGKTAIADSVAETCRRRGLLGATFFFSSLSGSVDRSSKRKLVATLAYHLSQHDALPQFQAQLHVAIERHPDVFHKSLKVQAECLILEPFQNIRGMGAKVGWPRVIIIDGLDEVTTIRRHSQAGPQMLGTSEDDQVEILRVLLTLSQSPSFPLRIFVACRPERNIAEFLATNAGSTTTNLFLDSKYEPDVDVRQFFQARFADIRRRAGISWLSWPGQSVLDRLVDMSSGQFIVPTTIIRWIEAGIPQLQLAEVLKMNQVNSGRKRNPFATLDALYRNILERAHNPKDDPRLAVKWILCATAVAGGRRFLFSSPCLEPSAMFWRQFLEDVEGEMTYRLSPIVSLMSVPLKGDTRGPVSIYHKSLTDFLESPDRCGDLYVDDTAYNSFIADRIVSTLQHRGPVVPLPSSAELTPFLQSFFQLKLLMLPDTLFSPILPPRHAQFLTCLTRESKYELASCDVAWWTAVSLSGCYTDGSDPRWVGDGNYGCHNGYDLGAHITPKPWLIRSIYLAIHKAMECASNMLPVAEQPTGGAFRSQCHKACILWMTKILATAKALDWCVHELEQVGIEELEFVSNRDSEDKFRRVGSTRSDGSVVSACPICRTVSNHN